MDDSKSDLDIGKSNSQLINDYNKKIRLLTDSFSKMLELQNSESLFQHLGNMLFQYYPKTIVLISKADDSKKEACIASINGINSIDYQKAIELVGFNFIGRTFNIDENHYQLLKTGKLTIIPDNLDSYSSPDYPAAAIKAFISFLNITKSYVIGIKKDKVLLAVVHLFSQDDSEIADYDFIELLAKQTGGILQKLAVETALKESEAHFYNLANMGQALIWTAGLDKKCNYFNNTWLEFTGRSLEQELGDGWLEGVHPDDLNRCLQIYTTCFDRREKFSMDYRIKRFDGEYRWIQDDGTPMYNNKNEFLGYIGHCLDITEHKTAEEELLKFKLGIERADEVIFITNPDGIITYANPSFEKVYGFSLDETLGKTPRIIKSGVLDEVVYKTFWETLQAKNSVKGELINKAKNGNLINIDGSASPIIDHKGNTIGYLAVQYDITQRKLSELHINKLSKAIDQSPLSVVITDINGNMEYVNPYFCYLTGFSREEVIGKNPRILHDKDENNTVFYKDMWEALLAGKEWRGEFRNKKKNGEIYYESAILSPVIGDSGEITNIVGVKEDITERKKIEKALKENERFLSEAQHLSRTGHYIIDYDSQLWKSSPVLDDILGIDLNFEKTTLNFGKLISPEYSHIVLEYLNQSKELNKPFCHECKIKKHSDGQEVWILIRGELQRHGNNEPKNYIGTIQDITDRKKAEHDLMLSNARLESLLQISNYDAGNTQNLLDFSLNEAIKLTESKIGYIYLYDEETKLFTLNSWSKEVLPSCMVMEVNTVYELDKTGCWGDVVRTRQPVIINNYKPSHPIAKGTPEGHVTLKKFLSIPVKVDNKIVAVIGVANKDGDYNPGDIMQLTLMMDSVWKIVERQKMIEELITAKEKAVQSDNLKSAFLANMSHEIRTPMNAIMGFAELLMKKSISEKTVGKYAEIIHSRSNYLLTLIDDILDLSKVEAGILKIHKEPFEINKLFDELDAQFKLKLQKTNHNLKFKVIKERTDGNSIIVSDKNRIQQLLTNLTDNALKFTKEGSITMEYKFDLEKGIVFSVSDTGIGIPAKDLNNVFERFHKSNDYALNYSGLGLGLSICKGLVHIMGGEIWIESNINEGTTFKFNIPVEFTISEKVATPAFTGIMNDANQGVILLVEDDPFNMELFISILNNYEVLVAENGASALKLFHENTHIDLILMDIGLPDMSGFEVTRKIRNTQIDIPIIALTAFVAPNDQILCKEAGCNDFLPKPLEANLLLMTVNKYISQFKKLAVSKLKERKVPE